MIKNNILDQSINSNERMNSVISHNEANGNPFALQDNFQEMKKYEDLDPKE